MDHGHGQHIIIAELIFKHSCPSYT